MSLALGIGLAGLVLTFLLVAWHARRRGRDERASRPKALANAQLVYMEALFRIQEPIPLVAKVDRVYRLASGALVLVELKTRRQSRPYLTDVIQLSAQRLAIERQTGAVVEPYAFVTVLGVGRGRQFHSHRVALLDADALVRLHRRRQAILAMRVTLTYACSQAACLGCSLRSKCDRFGGRG